MWLKLCCTVFFILLSENIYAQEDILVNKAWLRESVPGQQSASLQLNLTVTSPGNLIGVSSPFATEVQIQHLLPNRGKINNSIVSKVHLSRDRTLAFGEHSYALMLIGLKKPLQVGDQIPVTITVEFSNKQVRHIETEAEVRALTLSYKHFSGQEVHDHQ
jgi:copper(I)-binding protein